MKEISFQGDSGGPLVHRNSDTEQFTLIGVVAGYLLLHQCEVKYEVIFKIWGIPGKNPGAGYKFRFGLGYSMPCSIIMEIFSGLRKDFVPHGLD